MEHSETDIKVGYVLAQEHDKSLHYLRVSFQQGRFVSGPEIVYFPSHSKERSLLVENKRRRDDRRIPLDDESNGIPSLLTDKKKGICLITYYIIPEYKEMFLKEVAACVL